MKPSFIAVLFLIAVVAASGCTQYEPSQQITTGDIEPEPEEPIREITGEQGEESEQAEEPEVGEPLETAAKEFDITARQFEFEPSTITVSLGDRVIFHIESIDVAHGFSLAAFGINERLDPRQRVDIEFVADKRGTFPFVCSVFCGSGHSGMRGTLIVE